jgi:hypothetical protein
MRHAQRVNGAEEETDVSLEYRPVRVEPCLCGGVLVADPTNSVQVLWMVRQHRRTWQHQAWLRAMEGRE